MCIVSLERHSISSSLVIPSGRRRGIAATQVLSRSSLGLRSPLKKEREREKEKLLVQ